MLTSMRVPRIRALPPPRPGSTSMRLRSSFGSVIGSLVHSFYIGSRGPETDGCDHEVLDHLSCIQLQSIGVSCDLVYFLEAGGIGTESRACSRRSRRWPSGTPSASPS